TPTDQLIGSPRAAHAAPGDLRETVTVPFGVATACDGGDVGTALTLVPGGKAGFPDSKTLLVTSCVSTPTESPSQINLYFTDPVFCADVECVPAATIRRTLTTIFPSTATAAQKPTNGWQALVLRGDKGDIMACGVNGTSTVLWSIDFSPF